MKHYLSTYSMPEIVGTKNNNIERSTKFKVRREKKRAIHGRFLKVIICEQSL